MELLSFPSFPFIVFFMQVFWSIFATLFKFFSKKTNSSSTKFSILFLSPVSLSFVSYVFMSLQIFPLLFPLISWAFFFSFLISDCLFWVSATVLRSLSPNLFLTSSRSCSFSDSYSPLRPVRLNSCLVFDFYFSMRVVKLSLRPRAVFANFRSCLSYRLYFLLSHLLSLSLLAIPFIIRMSFSLFHAMMDLRKWEKQISLQVF